MNEASLSGSYALVWCSAAVFGVGRLGGLHWPDQTISAETVQLWQCGLRAGPVDDASWGGVAKVQVKSWGSEAHRKLVSLDNWLWSISLWLRQLLVCALLGAHLK